MNVPLWVALAFMFCAVVAVGIVDYAVLLWQRREFRMREAEQETRHKIQMDGVHEKLRLADAEISQLKGQVSTLFDVIKEAYQRGDITVSAAGNLNINEFVGKDKSTEIRTSIQA